MKTFRYLLSCFVVTVVRSTDYVDNLPDGIDADLLNDIFGSAGDETRYTDYQEEPACPPGFSGVDCTVDDEKVI